MSNPAGFKPLRGLLLVKRDKPDEEIGGIIIPENCKEYGWRATVVRPGPAATSYKAGDVILFQKEYTVLPFKDRTYAVTDSEHVIAKLVVGDGVERIHPVNRHVMIRSSECEDDAGTVINPNAKNHEAVSTGCVVKAAIDCLDVGGDSFVMIPNGPGLLCIEDDDLFLIIHEDEIIAISEK